MFSYGLEYMFFKDSYFAYSVAKNNEKGRDMIVNRCLKQKKVMCKTLN